MNYFSQMPSNKARFDDISYECNINDCQKFLGFTDEIMQQISQRIYRITKMNPIPRYDLNYSYQTLNKFIMSAIIANLCNIPWCN